MLVILVASVSLAISLSIFTASMCTCTPACIHDYTITCIIYTVPLTDAQYIPSLASYLGASVSVMFSAQYSVTWMARVILKTSLILACAVCVYSCACICVHVYKINKCV